MAAVPRRSLAKKILMSCLVLVIAFLVFGVAMAAFEQIEGGPWYTYKDQNGIRFILFTNPTRDTRLITDEHGNPKIVSGWSYSIPEWLAFAINTLNVPVRVGHLLVDPFIKSR